MRLSAIVRFLLPALLAASAAAAQQPPPRDPVDDATMRLGPVGLTPVIAFRDVGRDTNVFNEATNPKSDFTATFAPKLDVLVHPGPALFTLTTTADYVYFHTYSSERGTSVSSTLRGDFTFGPVKPFFSAGGGNLKGRVNREIDTRARHRDRAYSAGARVQIYEGLFVSGAARQSTTTFDEDQTFRGEDLATALNEKMDAIDGTVGVAVTPLTTVSVVVTQERDRFDHSSERDSDTLRISPTVTFSPLAILTGTASFGYRRFDVLSGAAPDYHGFVASLTLGTTVLEHHHFDATFGRDVQYSYEQDAIYYVETGLQGVWTWQIVKPIDLRLEGSRSRLHYPSTALTGSTDDTAYTYGGGVAYRIRDTLRVGLNADFRARESERGADRGFDSHRIYATVTWGKQQ